MSNKLYLVALSVALLSCQHNAKKTTSSKMSIVKTEKTITIPIDANSKLYSNDIHYYSNNASDEYISISNRTIPNQLEIYIYNIKTQKFDRKICINTTKYNMGRIVSHGFLDKNDIILTSTNKIMYRVDSTGNVTHVYDFNKYTETYITHSFFSSNPYMPAIINNGKLYCVQEYTGIEDGTKQPIAVTVDTATNNINLSSLAFPTFFEDDNKFHDYVYSRIFDGKNFVYSFFAQSDIYVTSDYKTFTKYPAPSKLLKNFKDKGRSKNVDMEEHQKQYLAKAEFGSIVYDQKNDVYYRFCFQQLDKKKINTQYYFENLLCKGDFSIQIINKDFQVVGETMFKAGKYAPKIFFVNDDGLWLSENNFEREDMDEYTLVFRCLKLQEAQK